jgi:hypothetical protein
MPWRSDGVHDRCGEVLLPAMGDRSRLGRGDPAAGSGDCCTPGVPPKAGGERCGEQRRPVGVETPMSAGRMGWSETIGSNG